MNVCVTESETERGGRHGGRPPGLPFVWIDACLTQTHTHIHTHSYTHTHTNTHSQLSPLLHYLSAFPVFLRVSLSVSTFTWHSRKSDYWVSPTMSGILCMQCIQCTPLDNSILSRAKRACTEWDWVMRWIAFCTCSKSFPGAVSRK